MSKFIWSKFNSVFIVSLIAIPLFGSIFVSNFIEKKRAILEFESQVGRWRVQISRAVAVQDSTQIIETGKGIMFPDLIWVEINNQRGILFRYPEQSNGSCADNPTVDLTFSGLKVGSVAGCTNNARLWSATFVSPFFLGTAICSLFVGILSFSIPLLRYRRVAISTLDLMQKWAAESNVSILDVPLNPTMREDALFVAITRLLIFGQKE